MISTPDLQSANLLFVRSSTAVNVWLNDALMSCANIPSIVKLAVLVAPPRGELWEYSADIANTVKNFLARPTPTTLRQIMFVTSSLTLADVLSLAMRQAADTAAQSTPTTNDSSGTEPQATESPSGSSPPQHSANPDVGSQDTQQQAANTADEWHEIERILAHQPRKDGMYYRVQWKDPTEPPCWLRKRDVTQFAIDKYYETRPQRRPYRRWRRRTQGT